MVEGLRAPLFEVLGLVLFTLLEAAGNLEELLLAEGTRLALWKAAGLEVIPSGASLFVAWGPVRTGPDAGIGLWFVGEIALGSGSSVIETPFPFFLVVNGVTISRLAELLVMQVLPLGLSSPADGTDELIARGKK